MFISITERHIRTLEMDDAEKRAAEQIAIQCREDEMDVSEYCRMAMSSIGNEQWEIFRPKAEICKNRRVNDRFFDGSGCLDVWIQFLAFNPFAGAYDVGVCLSDIWDTSWDEREKLIDHMYLNIFNGKKPAESYLRITDGTCECHSCGKRFDTDYAVYLKEANFCPACGCKWQNSYIREKERER